MNETKKRVSKPITDPVSVIKTDGDLPYIVSVRGEQLRVEGQRRRRRFKTYESAYEAGLAELGRRVAVEETKE